MKTVEPETRSITCVNSRFQIHEIAISEVTLWTAIDMTYSLDKSEHQMLGMFPTFADALHCIMRAKATI